MGEGATRPARGPTPTEAVHGDTTASASTDGGALMGHRALVARERPDGRHDLHYSQWGGADCSLAGALAGGAWPPEGVTAAPLATGVAWVDVLGEHLDPLVHEALYVEADGAVTAYRSLWLGADPADPAGLLVAVRWADPCDDERVRAWFAGARSVAGAARERDALDAATAATVVERCLREWAGDREVVRVP